MMNVLRWMVRRTKQKGAIQTLKIAASFMIDAFFDWKYGTDTMRWLDKSAICTGSANKVHAGPYQATKARPLLRLLRALHLPKDAVFVDIGCGKGRVLLMASNYGFRKVVGIEFSGELCAIARKNIEIYSRRRPIRSPIEVIETDATQYQFQAEERVLFMYNPFDASILSQVIENLRHSITTNSRKIWLIYNTPLHHEVVKASGLFESVSFHEFGGNQFQVYENSPQ